MTYKIEYLYDEHDCDTCGRSRAEGYKIYKDDVLVIDKSPSAYCYNSVDHPQSEAAFDILKLEGVEVIANDDTTKLQCWCCGNPRGQHKMSCNIKSKVEALEWFLSELYLVPGDVLDHVSYKIYVESLERLKTKTKNR